MSGLSARDEVGTHFSSAMVEPVEPNKVKRCYGTVHGRYSPKNPRTPKVRPAISGPADVGIILFHRLAGRTVQSRRTQGEGKEREK
jgi:hypothetical protein